jgi:hypothetical protein
MRKTEASVWMQQSSSRALTRALRLAVVALGIGIVMMAGAARAGDDDDEDDGRSFEDKIIGKIIAGVGGTNMDNRGIDYRERSPLVVPPKLDLPPPAAATNETKIANWPKDPDEKRRKAAIAERKKFTAKTVLEDARPLSPTELDPAGSRAAARTNSDPSQPGNPLDNSVLSKDALGFNGSFGNIFATKPESAQFKGEPTRDSLTQPPVGYQTPSPNYAYGIGTKDSMVRQSDPIADSVAGKP